MDYGPLTVIGSTHWHSPHTGNQARHWVAARCAVGGVCKLQAGQCEDGPTSTLWNVPLP
jgi:hypothetical protein